MERRKAKEFLEMHNNSKAPITREDLMTDAVVAGNYAIVQIRKMIKKVKELDINPQEILLLGAFMKSIGEEINSYLHQMVDGR